MCRLGHPQSIHARQFIHNDQRTGEREAVLECCIVLPLPVGDHFHRRTHNRLQILAFIPVRSRERLSFETLR